MVEDVADGGDQREGGAVPAARAAAARPASGAVPAARPPLLARRKGAGGRPWEKCPRKKKESSEFATTRAVRVSPLMGTPGSKFVRQFKCITIGDEGVGKSCLMEQFTDRKMQPEHYPTVEVEFGFRTIDIDDRPTKLQIWDMAGREWLVPLTTRHYRGAAAAILVYDITRRDTFDHVARWLKDAEKHTPANLTVVLVGNKCDLSDRRAVSYEEGDRFAKEHGLMFFESSAKTVQNVDEAFITAARIVNKKIEDGILDSSAQFGGSKFCLSGGDACRCALRPMQ